MPFVPGNYEVKNKYTVWKDYRTGSYEVICWKEPNVAIIMQTNIPTLQKAIAACQLWRRREEDRNAGK